MANYSIAVVLFRMDLERLYTQLITIEGLDIWDGLSHVSGSREIYADTLKLSCGELEPKIDSIEIALKEEAWQDYTMAVHAVKGAFAGIGAFELAQKSLELEHASRNGDYKSCGAATGALLTEMIAFTGALRSTVLFEEDTTPREQASLAFLEEKLAALNEACMSFSSTKVEDLIRELKTKTFDKEHDDFVKELCGYAENLDYNLVVKALKATS
jgi:HPt (histidine-containing phosphotransfer) domain-containing protein